jgi:hypothetical protein
MEGAERQINARQKKLNLPGIFRVKNIPRKGVDSG